MIWMLVPFVVRELTQTLPRARNEERSMFLPMLRPVPCLSLAEGG